MKNLDLLNQFGEQITQLRQLVQAASSMGMYDINKVCENVICGLLRELYGWEHLRNLNKEKGNFPSIDLADDVARVAVQVTATAEISKVKKTVGTFEEYEFNKKYDRLIIYVLTEKQKTYSQSAIDGVTEGEFKFSTRDDIWDYQNICSQAANATPRQLAACIRHLEAYLKGVNPGFADEDIDPPVTPSETLFTNLVEVKFPSRLYIAEIIPELKEFHRKRWKSGMRTIIREFNLEQGRTIPSSYVVFGGAIISFSDLGRADSPFRHLIEPSTLEEHRSPDFWGRNEDQERVFKSLLRFSLQQRLFREKVIWNQNERQFIFYPWDEGRNQRKIEWKGRKVSTRDVFVRKVNKKDPSRIDYQKHLSFSVEFTRIDEKWVMAITPSWFFSYGDKFLKSASSWKHLSWIKRQEHNKEVVNHVRFLSSWLSSLEKENLFDSLPQKDLFLTFGELLTLGGGRSLDESLWETVPEGDTENEDLYKGGLFPE